MNAGGDEHHHEGPDDGYFVPYAGGTTPSEPLPVTAAASRIRHVPRLLFLAVIAVAAAVALAVTAALVQGTDRDAPARAAAQPVPAPEQDGFKLWATNEDGSAVRWDPCEPIRWVLGESSPEGARTALEEAFAGMSRATGLRFAFDGATAETPSGARSPFQPSLYGGERWAPVLVAWASPGVGDVPLGERDRAVAIPVAVGADGRSVFVSGQIVFNRDRPTHLGSTDRSHAFLATAMHELGHLVGLDHVTDPDQLMFPHPHLGVVDWGDGDLRGLAAVGADGGCVDTPDPQPVEVTYAPDFRDP